MRDLSQYADLSAHDRMKRKFAAYLFAYTNLRQIEIAHLLGYNNNGSLATFRNDPTFVAEVKELQAQIRDQVFRDVLKRLQEEASSSLQVLIDIRDNKSGEESTRCRLDAAIEILNKAIPTKTYHLSLLEGLKPKEIDNLPDKERLEIEEAMIGNEPQDASI